MKRIQLVVLPLALALMLMLPATAFAAGNTTDVEQKWVDFQKAVTDQMVKDGKMTRQQADAQVKEFQTKFAESTGDSIYQFFAEKHQGGNGPCKDGKCGKGHPNREDAALRVYSMLTGKSVDDLQKACSSANMTIWQLAQKEGKLDDLKSKLINTQSASMDVLVKGGMMTAEQKNKIIDKIREELNKKQ
jgi:polyhydroxyalkanoate synthesis regulator phasin